MNRFMTALAFGLGVSPATTAAQEVFTPPEGCETFLTVQMSSCQVSVMWRCDVAPEGDKWDAMFTQDGLQSIVAYDRDFQWIDALYMWDSSQESLIEPSKDPISMDALLETGVDTFSFFLKRVVPGEDERKLLVIGADELTSETVEIDGVPLQVIRTEFRIIAEDGSEEYNTRGTQLLSPEMRTFFLHEDEVIEDGKATPYDNTPVDFIFPGEPGFGLTRPLYGCDVIKSDYIDGIIGGQTNAG